MKGKAGRPRIPFSNISNRKGDGLTGSPSPAPAGEGNAQLARGGKAKPNMAKKSRGAATKHSGVKKKADGGPVSGAKPSEVAGKWKDGAPANIGDSEPDTGPEDDIKSVKKK